MRWTNRVLIGAAAIALCAGCNQSTRTIGSQDDGSSGQVASWDEGAALPPFDPSVPRSERVALRGTMGDADSSNAQGATTTLMESNATVRIDATSASAHYWMMTRLDLPDRTTLRSSPLGTVFDSSSSNWVLGLGCSGPAIEDYTFDAPADRVRLRIDQGAEADTRLVRFVANFGSQTVAGAFEIASR